MTFSVVARDPATGELGIAVSSCILAVVDVTPGGFVLRETAPGVSVDEVQAATGAPLTVADDVREMPLPATV